MATAIGLGMQITANTSGFTRGVSRVEQQLDRMDRSARKSAAALSVLSTIEVGRLAVDGVRALYGVVDRVTSSVSSMVSRVNAASDALADMTERTGVSAEGLQSLQFAAELSGVEDITFALQKMNVTIGNVIDTGKTKVFDDIGLSFLEIAALSPEDQFTAIAQAIQALPTSAERAAAAVSVFGRSGVQLLPLFASGVADVRKEFDGLNAGLSGRQVSSIDAMNDAFTKVRRTLDGIIGQVVANFAPAVTALADELLAFVRGVEGADGTTGGAALADRISESLFAGAETVAVVFDESVAMLDDFASAFATATADLAKVAPALGIIVESLRGVFNLFQLAGDTFGVAVGKLLEGLGSFVSSDLEQFGRDMAAAAVENMAKNTADFNSVIGNVQGLAAPAARAQREQGLAFRALQAAREAFASRRDSVAVEAQRRADDEQEQGAAEQDKQLEAATQRFFERRAEIHDEIIRANRRSNEALRVNDIRSGGIDEVLRLASGREDPGLAEARRQTAELERLRQEVIKLGGTVDILGGA